MKNKIVVCIMSCFLLLGLTTNAQENIVKAAPISLAVQTGLGSGSVGYLFLTGFEHSISDKLSIQGDLGFTSFSFGGFGNFGGRAGLFVIKPSVKYYLLDEVLHGVNIGGYTSLSIGAGGTIIGIGPQAGYQHLLLDDRLAIFGDLGMGIGIGTGGISTGFNLSFVVGAGYAF